MQHVLNVDFPYYKERHQVQFTRNEHYLCTRTEIIDVANSDFFKDIGLVNENFVRSKLEEFQDMTSSLADEVDKDNRTALSIASSGVQEVFHKFMYFMGRYEFKNDECVMTKDEFDDCFNSWDFFADALTYKSISSIRSQEKFHFYDCDLDKGDSVSEKEFISYCSKIFGATRTVVLKFMKNKDQYRKEIDARLKKNLDAKFVINIISGSEEDCDEDVHCHTSIKT